MTALRRALAPALVLSAVLATAATAQSTLPITVEVRAGAAIPTGEFDDGASTGWGVGATVRYAVSPMVELYAGYDHFDFGSDEDLEDVDAGLGFKDAGLRAGGRFIFAPLGSVRPWVEGGLLFNRSTISVSVDAATFNIDSNWGIGLEAGAGFAVALSPRVSLTPGVRYRFHESEFDLEELEEEEEEEATIDVSYVAIDLGVSIRL